jgi:hypothetical protein
LRGFEGSAVAVMDSVDRGGGDGQRVGRDEGAQLRVFRSQCYGALTRRADALFELGDALLCQDGAVTSPAAAEPGPGVPPWVGQCVCGAVPGADR